MQDRNVGDAVADRRIAKLMYDGYTQEEAEAEVYGSEQYAERRYSYDYYNTLNDKLNQLYASVGLDPAGSITGSGTSHGNGYTVDFDFVSGDVSHNKGDAIHDFGKGLIKGIAGAAFGAGLTSFLTSAGLGANTASLISKFIVNTVTGSGGKIGIEDALSLALGPGGEFADVDIGGDIQDAIIDYVTDPENYDDNNRIVWGEHGGNDEIGNPVINILTSEIRSKKTAAVAVTLAAALKVATILLTRTVTAYPTMKMSSLMIPLMVAVTTVAAVNMKLCVRARTVRGLLKTE